MCSGQEVPARASDQEVIGRAESPAASSDAVVEAAGAKYGVTALNWSHGGHATDVDPARRLISIAIS
jgi:hypothetical protein